MSRYCKTTWTCQPFFTRYVHCPILHLQQLQLHQHVTPVPLAPAALRRAEMDASTAPVTAEEELAPACPDGMDQDVTLVCIIVLQYICT